MALFAKQTVVKTAVAAAAISVLAGVAPLAIPVATGAPTAPPWAPDPNAASYSGVVFFDASGNVVTSGTNLSNPFAYAVASTAADTGATKASLAFANPQHGVTTSNWSPVANEGGPTVFSPSSSLPAGTPGDIVGFAPTYPIVVSGANITSWLASVGTGLETTTGYANTIQVRLTDSGLLGHGNPPGTYWESDIAFNTTASPITVEGTMVPANGWAQIFPFTAPSTISLASPQSAATQPSGTSVVLNATVTPTTATAMVQFYDGTTILGHSTVSGGAATFIDTRPPAVGTHSYTASYIAGPPPGDEVGTNTTSATIVAGSASNTVSVTIGATAAATTTAVVSSLNPSVFGQSVTFTATVTPTSGTGTPTGTVTFLDGTTTLGTGTLSAGMASFSTSALSAGSHVITATYGGNTNFAGSTGSMTGNPQVVNKANTATAVTSSVNPSVFGQSITFTATVTPTSGTGVPTGTVTFLDGTTTLGTGTLTNGVATFTTSSLAVGSHTITTSYPGDANFNGSTGSLTGNPQVVKNATMTTVTNLTNPSTFGQSVTFTATVTPSSGTGIPTGTVTFLDGTTTLGTGTLSAGMASFSTSALSAGSHTISASYGGDATFAPSTGPLTGNPQVVNKANTATTVTSSTNPSVFGQPVTFTATVTPTSGTGPTGTVTFLDGTTTLGTGTLSAGVATFTTSTLPVGSHTITATYGGDGNFNTSTGPLTGNPQVVNKTNTATAVTNSQNPSVFGQSVTFTATVTPSSGSGTPTGTVTFLDGSTSIGTGTLSGGVATFTTAAFAVGSHTITTSYGGDGNFNTSIGSLTGNPQVVNKDTTTTTLKSSANPSSPGQPVTFTGTVTAYAPGGGTPTGTVSFLDGSSTICSHVPLSGAMASCTPTPFSSTGTHVITAVYSGDGNFVGSTSSPLSQTVTSSSSPGQLGAIPQTDAFQAAGGNLWSIGSTGWMNWGLGVAPGTSPSIATLSNGGFEIAFHANGGGLWTVGTFGWIDWGLGMAPWSSPAIVGLPNGGFEVAFQANTGHLWTVGTAGSGDWGLGMASWSSPAITSLSGGGFEVALQANTGSLWIAGAGGWANLGLGMASSTSPAITSLAGGSFEVAFQANTGQLWTVGGGASGNWGLGMASWTSPAIVSLPGGGFQVAFQSNAGYLWTVGDGGWKNWQLSMASGTSPSIAVEPGGRLLESYQGADGNLATVGTGAWDWALGMATGTSPSVR